MSIVLAIFFIGCLTIIGFIALMLYIAFIHPKKEPRTWTPVEPLTKQFQQRKRMYRGRVEL